MSDPLFENMKNIADEWKRKAEEKGAAMVKAMASAHETNRKLHRRIEKLRAALEKIKDGDTDKYWGLEAEEALKEDDKLK